MTVLDDVRRAGRLVCGVLTGFEPFGFRAAQSSEPIGYEVDLARELARHLGVELAAIELSAAQRLPSLLEGKVDILAALMSWNAERDSQMDFSGVYSKDVNQLLVRADSRITHADQVARRSIGALVGTSLTAVAKARYPDIDVPLYADAAQACRALVDGDVDAIFLRTTSLIALQKQHPRTALTILPQVLLAPETAFAVRKGQADFIEELNRFLALLEREGTAQRLFDKWLGADSSYGMTRQFTVGQPISKLPFTPR